MQRGSRAKFGDDRGATVAGFHAKGMFHNVQLPRTVSQWAEAMSWACDALNRTAANAIPETMSPHEIWHREAVRARFPSTKTGLLHMAEAEKVFHEGRELSIFEAVYGPRHGLCECASFPSEIRPKKRET